MLISIFASIWCQNLWDELILKNEILELEKEYSTIDKKGQTIRPKFIVFSYDRKNPFYTADNVSYKSYFPIWIRKKRNILKNLFWFLGFLHHSSRSDLIVIWGGGIFYDSEKQVTQNPLAGWNFRSKIFRFFRLSVEMYGVWIDIEKNSNKKILEQICRWVSRISVRDKKSYDTLSGLNIPSKIITDPVFSDNKNYLDDGSYMIKQVNSLDFTYNDITKFNLEGKRIGLALRQWYLAPEGNMQERMEEGKINELLNYLLAQWAQIILLPHSFHKTDDQANDYLFLKKFLRPWRAISIRNSMQDVYEQYTLANMDLCIAMRLHSIILSQVYEIPYVAVSYSKKTDEILKSINK